MLHEKGSVKMGKVKSSVVAIRDGVECGNGIREWELG
jgi:hypothetical protein